MTDRVLHNPLNGRFTTMGILPRRSYDVAKSQENSNYWSVTEYNSNNAWNVNFGSGNVNNNNKYNSNVVRPVAAHDGFKYDFIGLPIHAEDDRPFVDFFQGVHDAYRDCMRGKMSSSQAIEYMQIAWADLPSLAWELWAGTYKPSTSTCFLVKYPKLREVFAANFRDRIVHHWVCLRLEPLFEMRFMAQGDVSFNCRKGYGTQKCVEHCAAGMKEVTGGYQRPAWIFKGDLVGFFMSIDKHLLWYLLERFIVRWRKREARGAILQLPMYWDILQRTTKVIVMHHPEEDCVLNSDPALWRGLPPNKSLFGCSKDKGEPIGNLTTQLFANFLMSFFDQHITFMFRRKGFSYVRFVDDFCIVCNDKKFLLSAIPKIEKFLDESLKLTLHKDKRYIQPASHGVALVGSYIKPNRIYISNRTLARFEERIVGFNRMMEERALNELDCKRIEQVVNSYLGFCKGKRTYKRRKEILDKFGGEFFKYFFIRGHYESIRAKNKYRELELYQAL